VTNDAGWSGAFETAVLCQTAGEENVGRVVKIPLSETSVTANVHCSRPVRGSSACTAP
jgi:hypothetical protein